MGRIRRKRFWQLRRDSKIRYNENKRKKEREREREREREGERRGEGKGEGEGEGMVSHGKVAAESICGRPCQNSNLDTVAVTTLHKPRGLAMLQVSPNTLSIRPQGHETYTQRVQV